VVKAIRSGDLSAAQQAYATFSQSPAGQAAASSQDGASGSVAQTLSQIGQALQSGDIGQAQQLLSSLAPRPQGAHHHHHRADRPTPPPTATGAADGSASTADSGGVGTSVNLTV
jgi:hypothetical protein